MNLLSRVGLDDIYRSLPTLAIVQFSDVFGLSLFCLLCSYSKAHYINATIVYTCVGVGVFGEGCVVWGEGEGEEIKR